MKRTLLTAAFLLLAVVGGLYGIFVVLTALVFGSMSGITVGVLALLAGAMGLYGAIRVNLPARA